MSKHAKVSARKPAAKKKSVPAVARAETLSAADDRDMSPIGDLDYEI